MVKADRRLGSSIPPGASRFLICNECGGSLTEVATDRLECIWCHAQVASYDGIVDFVAGASVTSLDNIDYDQFYCVNAERSVTLYNTLKASAGALWPADFGDVLEIGSGTGGFSMALLGNADLSHAVLTDVSVKMLGICRRRLETMPGIPHDAIEYATYSGIENCFRTGAFDTCCGTFVVHHIVDVPQFLTQIYRLLKPGGRAFFMEPNAKFHQALTRTVANIVAEWLRTDAVQELDTSRMLNWTGEVHCNIVNSGDIEVLAGREDKHIFVGEWFEATAKAAGFNRATALSTPIDPTGANTAEVYLNQCGVSLGTMALLRKVWPAAQAMQFDSLRPKDRSPSYLFWLEKGPRKRQARHMETSSIPMAISPATAAINTGTRPRLWLMLTLRRQDSGLHLTVDGWCLSQDAMRAVDVELCGVRTRMPIWLPRPDVHRAINQAGEYPPLHALCCGIAGNIVVTDGAVAGDTIEVSVRVLPVNGPAFPIQRLMLSPDGDSMVLE